MAIDSSTQSVPSHAGTPADVHWRAWPLVDGGPDRVIVPAAILAVAIVVGLSTASVVAAVMAGMVGVLACVRFFVPTSYSLERQGVTVTTAWRRATIAWNAISRYEARADGMVIVVGTARGPMNWFRRWFLPWPPDQQSALQWIDHRSG